MSEVSENKDREIYREKIGDFYSDSIHVTEDGAIGISCGGSVYEKSIKLWSKLADECWEKDITINVLEAKLDEAVKAFENISAGSEWLYNNILGHINRIGENNVKMVVEMGDIARQALEKIKEGDNVS
jgi:hypothetical protein